MRIFESNDIESSTFMTPMLAKEIVKSMKNDSNAYHHLKTKDASGAIIALEMVHQHMSENQCDWKTAVESV